MESTAKAKTKRERENRLLHVLSPLRFALLDRCRLQLQPLKRAELPNLVGRDFLACMTGSGDCETEILRT
jgi:hypothetical protein